MSEGSVKSEEDERRSRKLVERIVEKIRKQQADGSQLPRVRDRALDELPDDDWHRHMYLWLDTSESSCCNCAAHPAFLWDFEDMRLGEAGCVDFAIRAVPYLKNLGWQFRDGLLCCPGCIPKVFPEV